MTTNHNRETGDCRLEIGDLGHDHISNLQSLISLIKGRRSVRRYQQKPVPHEALLEILEAARWAPSPHGRQPWRFVVLTRDAPKRALAQAMGEEWRSQLALDGQDQELIQLRFDKSRERIISAPAIVIPCLYLAELDTYSDEARKAAEATMAIQSLGCAVQNMLLMAYSLGLDGGWMCAPLFCPDVVVAALDLDPALIPHALITIGYAAADPVRRERLPLDQLIVRFD
jgi:F420 biosynthesis protein FbiB-like protein